MSAVQQGFKFGVLEGADTIPFAYPDVFSREWGEGWRRLTVGPSAHHIRLLLEFADCWGDDDFVILYVSLTSRVGVPAGRYQSPWPLSSDEMRTFFERFRRFFESDGRHHVWLSSVSGDGSIVYDQHNVLYAYGPVDEYSRILDVAGFTEADFSFPAPHVHCFNPSNDEDEAALFSYWNWIHSPLQPMDEP